MEIDEDGLDLIAIAGQYDNQGFDNVPTQSGLLHSPVRITCRGSSVYITEHPTDRQGSIRLFEYLPGLKEFSVDMAPGQQGIWDSTKEGWTNPEESNEKENIKINDAKDLFGAGLNEA